MSKQKSKKLTKNKMKVKKKFKMNLKKIKFKTSNIHNRSLKVKKIKL